MGTNDLPFADWLRFQIDRADTTPAELERTTGVRANDIRRYMQGTRHPSLRSAVKLARALGVSEEEFCDRAGVETPARRFAGRPRSVDDIWRELETQMPIAVPKLRSVVASAGGGEPVEEIEGYVYVPRRAGLSPGLRAITVAGDCMEPTIMSGDTVVYDKRLQASSGKLVVAGITEDGITQALVKRYVERADGPYLVPNKGAAIKVDERVLIEGVVVHSGRDY